MMPPHSRKEIPIMRRFLVLTILVSSLAVTTGCNRDPVKQMMTSEETKTKVLEAIAADPGLTSRLLGMLMQGEATRNALVSTALGNPETSQALIARIAQDQTMVDDILNLTSVDPAMHAHVVGKLQAMKRAGPAK
jgi:hypothetical protein